MITTKKTTTQFSLFVNHGSFIVNETYVSNNTTFKLKKKEKDYFSLNNFVLLFS